MKISFKKYFENGQLYKRVETKFDAGTIKCTSIFIECFDQLVGPLNLSTCIDKMQ